MRDREQFFSLVQTENLTQAHSFLDSRLSPEHDLYLTAAKTVFAYNVRVGNERATKVLWYSQLAPLVLGVLCVLVFGLGVLMGLRGAFIGLDLLFRKRSKL